MNQKILFTVFGLFSAISFAQAALLESTPSEFYLEGVTLSKSAKANLKDSSVALSAVNAGVRNKKILVINAKIYVTQLFVSDVSQFVKTAPTADIETDLSSLNSLGKINTVALKLDLLRDLDAATLVDSFDTALKANNLSSSSNQGLSAVLTAMQNGGDLSKKDSISLVGVNGDANDILYIENSIGASDVIVGDSKLVDNMFAIWFGTPADSGLASLKAALTK